MFEILFILIVIYIAYVIYNDDKQISNPPENDLVTPVNIASVKASSPPGSAKPKKTVIKAKPDAAKTKSTKPAKPKINKAAAPKIELRTVQMKNPKTGEQAKVANNYRMVKRWIKEALVEEGLLEKIYKVNEMDDTAKAEVAKALSIIKAMDKYKGDGNK